MNRDEQYPQHRAHPRLPLATPVEIHYGDRKIMGHTENISIGGLLAQCATCPPPAAPLTVLFNLPNGTTINTPGVVKHAHSGKVGVQFSSLPTYGREALEAFTARMEQFTRRGTRRPQRLHVTLSSLQSGSTGTEQMAETVLLSHNGGLLICRAPYDAGDHLRLYWSEKKRGAEIVIVFRRLCGTAGLAELGFQFVAEGNFWELDFETH